MDKKKKADEKNILFTVYRKDIIEELTKDHETPDFIITDKNNRRIGIEVTKVFSSRASSLMLKNDKFMDDFITRNKPGGKKKKKLLVI